MPTLITNTPSKNLQIGLAPMEGVTCLATRLWFSVVSRPSFAMTPFLRVTRDYPWKRVPSTYAAEIFDLKEVVTYSLIPQLMGNSPEDLTRIALPLLLNTDFIDINCGCPSPKVVGSHAGSSLLENPDTFSLFIDQMAQHLGAKRFSIKMRSGFHTHAEFPKLLSVVAQYPLAQLTLHARTRAERYTARSRWELIAEAAAQCPFPVVGSGDITDYTTFSAFLTRCPQVQKIIIGRGALRNPWIFQELAAGEKTTLTFETLSLALASYAVMQDFLQNNPLEFLAAAKNGVFAETCYHSEEKWGSFYANLVRHYYGCYIQPSEIVVAKQSFAKVKMIWNSLRSALGAPFMEPTLLRAHEFSQFYAQLQNIFEKQGVVAVLSYNQEYNWMYSGEKKDAN